MKRAFLGLTFLLAALIPVGGLLFEMLIQSMGVNIFNGSSRTIVYALTIVATYALPALITLWFFKSARLGERTPNPTPGAVLMLMGVLLSLVNVLVVFLASTVEGGGATFVVTRFPLLAVWPARILLVIGAVRFLLAVEPSNHSLNGDVARVTRH